MKKRIKLCDRVLPGYSRGEEVMNMVTHIAGFALGVAALLLCVIRSLAENNAWGVFSGMIYGFGMIALYAVSSIYHGLKPGMAKKVMQVIDHCTIYFLIAGSYTIVALCALRPVYPFIGWGLFIFEWALTALAVTLTAIDLKKYTVFSMICYIGMGWAVVPFMAQTYQVLGCTGFRLLLWGGIAYTVGSILYGLGKKRRWMHSVFHIFVVLGSLLQFLCVWLSVL